MYNYREPWWNDIEREKPKNSEKICPSATLSTTNLTVTDPGTNLDLRGEKSATNRLSHRTAELLVYSLVQSNGISSGKDCS
jgi:hypothetical protein